MYTLESLPIRRRSWVKVSAIPKARLGWVIADCTEAPTEVLAPLRKWLKGVEDGKVVLASGSPSCGRGLLFYGEPGRGKTTIALSIIQEMMTTFPLSSFAPSEGKVLIRPCYFATFNTILDLKGSLMEFEPEEDKKTLYAGMLGECKDDAYNIRVLIIDDVGKEHSSLSGWQRNMLHHVLRTRFNNGLPTIVTTNIARDKWTEAYGDATGSFAKEAFIYVPIASTQKDLR